MEIVLSAHFDLAKPVPYLKVSKGNLIGLVDNFAGVFVAWEAQRKTGIPLYLTNFEETGMRGAQEVAKKLKPNTLVIVVDTTRDAGHFPSYLGNVYNFNVQSLKNRFSKDIFFMPGMFEEAEDETWIYGHKFGLPTFYFGIPITSGKDYHAVNNTVTMRTIDSAAKILCKLIQTLKPEIVASRPGEEFWK